MIARTKIGLLSGAMLVTALLGGCKSIGEQDGGTTDAPGGGSANVAGQASSGFAIDLYRQLARENPGKNLFFSPYSISSALAVAAEGARGETAAEMGKTLRFPGAASTAELKRSLDQMGANELRIANALWFERSLPLRASYKKAIAGSYGREALAPADFRGDPEGARRQINGWVAQRTGGHIEELLAPGMVDRSTPLVITNAIYFLGKWSQPFSKEQTRNLGFFTTPSQKREVPTMRANLSIGRYGAFEGDGSWFATPGYYSADKDEKLYPDEAGFALLELPYQGDALSMVVLVPNRIDGLATIEASLTAAKLDTWIAKLGQRETQVFLPKFDLETDYGLKPALRALGMASAFVPPPLPGGADFGGMIDRHDRQPPLFISQVIHKAFVSMDEQGTEAAAATAVLMRYGASSNAPPQRIFIPTFRADRPFLFLIRDRRSGNLLFLGRITKP